MSKKSKQKGLFVVGHIQDKFAMGREFLKGPEAFAKRVGLDPKQLTCPSVAHKAFIRGQAFADEIATNGISPNSSAMPRLRRLATRHLGRDHAVSLIPFGLKFREKAASVGGEITATASGTVTFLDSDADVDG